jgi:hypothetical protein
MKSILTSLRSSVPLDRGHILVDFDIIEIPFEDRKTVAEQYGRGVIEDGAKDDYVLVAKIKGTKEFLMVPSAYGSCTYAKKSEPGHRPKPDHVNHPALQEILNGPASKTS